MSSGCWIISNILQHILMRW